MRASKSNKLNAERYRVLIDNAPEPVFIYDADTGKFIDYNASVLELFSYSAEEIPHIGPQDISPATIDGQPIGNLISGFVKEALLGGNPKFDWIHIDKHGESIPCEVRLIRFPPYDQKILRAVIIDLRDKLKLENELKESEERLKLALAATQAGYYDWNLETNERYWDDQMHAIMGLDKDSKVDKITHFFSLVHPEDRAWLQSNYHSAQDPNNPSSNFQSFYRIVVNGQTKYLESYGFYFRRANGSVYRIIGTARDITQRRKTEEQLQYQATVLEGISEAVISTDNDFIIRSWNQAATRIYGFTTEEAIGQSMYDLLPCIYIGTTEEQALKEFLANGVWRGEVKQPTKSGNITNILSSVSILRSADGLPSGAIAVNRDISQQKRAEQKLTQTQKELSDTTKRLQISTKAGHIGIWEWDIQKDQLYWDDTMFAIYGQQMATFEPSIKSWLSCIHQQDAPGVQKAMEKAIEHKTNFNQEFRATCPDQSIRFIKVAATIQSGTDNGLLMIGITMDVTKEKEAEEQKIRARQLELKNKELEQFAYVASHDLQEPLRTIVSFTDLFKRQYGQQLDESAIQYLQFISQGAMRMSHLIKGLLQYSRIGRNKAYTKIDCNQLVRDVLDDLSAQITETAAQIELYHLPTLSGYDMELRMLFQNLISNAIKFRKPDQPPQISISAKKESKHWLFSVADKGIGIPANLQKKIFVIFQRLHPMDAYEGTGIGLAHCQKIVDLHGGSIWVESEEELGSKFYFTIPINK